MTTIIIHPRTKEEIHIFENLAKQLNTPYEIKMGRESVSVKKPSDYLGTMSEEEGEKMHSYLQESRAKWERDI